MDMRECERRSRETLGVGEGQAWLMSPTGQRDFFLLCWGSNPSQPHAQQVPCPLSYRSSPKGQSLHPAYLSTPLLPATPSAHQLSMSRRHGPSRWFLLRFIKHNSGLGRRVRCFQEP